MFNKVQLTLLRILNRTSRINIQAISNRVQQILLKSKRVTSMITKNKLLKMMILPRTNTKATVQARKLLPKPQLMVQLKTKTMVTLLARDRPKQRLTMQLKTKTSATLLARNRPKQLLTLLLRTRPTKSPSARNLQEHQTSKQRRGTLLPKTSKNCLQLSRTQPSTTRASKELAKDQCPERLMRLISIWLLMTLFRACSRRH